MANHYIGDCEMAKEPGEMLLVLMQHCREMKRQETRSRWATGVMFLTFFAAFLWHQVSEHKTKDAPSQEPLPDVAGPQAQFRSSPRLSVHLLISSKQNENGASLVQKNGSYFIQWTYQHDSHKKYKLTDNSTSLIVPSDGQYLINLRVFYRIPNGRCKGKRLSLTISVIQHHPNYPLWRNVIEGKETMHCENAWCQSVNLHRVVHLNAKTEIKVKTDTENRDLISMDTYFGVTHL